MSNLPQYKMYIDGGWAEAGSGEWFETFDPYAGTAAGAGGARRQSRR
jgi:hypothetical protein